jgi:hypothetical protein
MSAASFPGEGGDQLSSLLALLFTTYAVDVTSETSAAIASGLILRGYWPDQLDTEMLLYPRDLLDLDDSATDNFSGDETYGYVNSTFKLPFVSMGATGAFDAPATTAQYAIVELQVGGAILAIPLLQAGLAISVVSETALSGARLYGLAPASATDATLLPAVASALNSRLIAALTSGTPACVSDSGILGDGTSADCPTDSVCSATNGTSTGICVTSTSDISAIIAPSTDADGDGNVTVAEIDNSANIRSIYSPDVDTSGDGVADSYTVSMDFEAVACWMLLHGSWDP